MRVYLSSDNHQLQQLCEQVFAECLQDSESVHMLTERVANPTADLFVWDIEPEELVFPDTEPAERWRHFFLVQRNDMSRFQSRFPFPDVNILLKPVTRMVLLAFVSNACLRLSEESAARRELSLESLQADRDAILQCLIQTNLRLQEYDQDRTNFLARAIHDFRAPLTAVTGYCGLLLGEDLGPLNDDQRELLERIQRSGRKLSRMTNAMFQLSIAQKVDSSPRLKKGEIRDCIERALYEIAPAATEKKITIGVDMADCVGDILLEETQVEQVLLNLLDNACRFTVRGGSISVHGYCWHWDGTAQSDAERSSSGPDCAVNSYRIDIKDNGPGIPAAHLASIFEEYTSYGGGADRSGGGLGLAICRMILNRHNGRIWAESGAYGATFSFVLPFNGGLESTSEMTYPPRVQAVGSALAVTGEVL